MGYGFIVQEHALEPDEIEIAEFIGTQRRMTGIIQRPPGQGLSLPEQMRMGSLDTFELALVKKVVERVGLADKNPSAILGGPKTLITCYVGHTILGS